MVFVQEREEETRKRMADIQKKKKENLKAREKLVGGFHQSSGFANGKMRRSTGMGSQVE
jgi:hypothetical protein